MRHNKAFDLSCIQDILKKRHEMVLYGISALLRRELIIKKSSVVQNRCLVQYVCLISSFPWVPKAYIGCLMKLFERQFLYKLCAGIFDGVMVDMMIFPACDD